MSSGLMDAESAIILTQSKQVVDKLPSPVLYRKLVSEWKRDEPSLWQLFHFMSMLIVFHACDQKTCCLYPNFPDWIVESIGTILVSKGYRYVYDQESATLTVYWI